MQTFVKSEERTSSPSTSSVGASPARTCPRAAEERRQASPEPGRACGASSAGSRSRRARRSSSSRTSRAAGTAGCLTCVEICTCSDTEPVPSRFLPRTSVLPIVVNASLSSRWPTPVTTDGRSAGRHTTTTGIMKPGTSLTDALRLLVFHQRRWDGASRPRPTINPRFSEALLGFPIGWTDLSPSATPSCPPCPRPSVAPRCTTTPEEV